MRLRSARPVQSKVRSRSPHGELLSRKLRIDLEFQGAGDLISLEESERLKTWLAEMVSTVAPEVDSVGVRLTDDTTMQEFNRRFRGHDKSTDVLSFIGGASPEGSHLGDILISAPQAERQAQESGIPLMRELQVLLLHGMLHCMGYDHETDDGAMERLERRHRDQWISADR